MVMTKRKTIVFIFVMQEYTIQVFLSYRSVVLNWFYIVHEMVTIYNTGRNLSLLFPWSWIIFFSKLSSLRMNVKQIVHFGISFSRWICLISIRHCAKYIEIVLYLQVHLFYYPTYSWLYSKFTLIIFFFLPAVADQTCKPVTENYWCRLDSPDFSLI